MPNFLWACNFALLLFPDEKQKQVGNFFNFGEIKMEQKRFLKNDQGFICENCGAKVEPLGSSSRNHCPFCLCSIHVDINPGDRSNPCKGLMRPIAVEPDAKKGYIIIHRCEKCGAIKRNKAAYGVAVQADNLDLLIRLTNTQHGR